MPYKANVLKVMIASPGDVELERNLIREVIYEWNVINSDTRKVVLLPVSWETHSVPEMGDRAQGIINKQLLKGCDLLIGVFWTRIGTPTGEYPSGSVEEIQEHIKAKKPVMLYFSSAPVRPDGIDEDQYSELKKFRELCKSNGLYETYFNPNEFKSKFNRQLQIKLNKDLPQLLLTGGAVIENTITESTLPDIPDMSREAQILLKEASQDQNGDIFQLHFIGGWQVQSNGKTFGNSSSSREQAIWEGAIDELERLGLIKDRGNERELFGVTREGYQIADIITL
jgi:hypothetical protein